MQDAFDQRALARSRHARDHIEGAESEVGIDALEVVFLGIAHAKGAHARAAVFRNGDVLAAQQVVRGEAVVGLKQVVRRSR